VRWLSSILLLIVAAFASEADLVIGTWKLNWAESRSRSDKPKSVTRTYRKAGSGTRVTELWVDAAGKTTKLDYTAAYDGKDYPVANNGDMTVTFLRHDATRAEGVGKRNGVVEQTFRRTVSNDGKKLTIEIKRADANGDPYTDVLVYDRVK
jgi:hypothetical protein